MFTWLFSSDAMTALFKVESHINLGNLTDCYYFTASWLNVDCKGNG